MNRLFAVALVVLAALPAVASAAVRPGTYKGTSSATVFVRADEQVDKGTVSFRVVSGKVRSFLVRGQKFYCGGQPVEVRISKASIRLNSRGVGRATYTNETLGPFKIVVRVTSRGTASGSVTPDGLCDDDYPAKFRAKRV